jgi:hypothetical protein
VLAPGVLRPKLKVRTPRRIISSMSDQYSSMFGASRL